MTGLPTPGNAKADRDAVGFLFYMVLAAFGVSALLLAVPYAYDALRLTGAAYLAWLAWQALKPGSSSGLLDHGVEVVVRIPRSSRSIAWSMTPRFKCAPFPIPHSAS